MSMENIENILEGIKKYERSESDVKAEFPSILEEYLKSVSKSGDPLLPWNVIRKFIKNKLEVVITEFFNIYGGEDLVEAKNLPSFSFVLTKNRILNHFDTFVGAPFTIQRLCEILVDPMRHYKRTDKFLRGLEKNILVVTHVEPGRNKRKCESPSHPFLANGVKGDQPVPHLSSINKSSVSYSVNTNSEHFDEERSSVGNLTASYLVGILNKDYENNGPVNKKPRLEQMEENDVTNHNGDAGSSDAVNVPFNENEECIANNLDTEHIKSSIDSGSCSSDMADVDNVDGDECSVSESSNIEVAVHKECDSGQNSVNPLSRLNDESSASRPSNSDIGKLPKISSQKEDNNEKEECLTAENVPQEIDKCATEAVSVEYSPIDVETESSYCPPAPVSPDNVKPNQGLVEGSCQEAAGSIDDSNFEESSRSPNSSQLSSTNEENASVSGCSYSEADVHQKSSESETFEEEVKPDDQVLLGTEVSMSRVLPASKVDSSNTVEESCDSEVNMKEKSISQSDGSPDSAQDVMSESANNLPEKQVRQNEQDCNSEATPSVESVTKSPIFPKGDNNSEVDSTSFSANSEASVLVENNFAEASEETNSSTSTSDLSHTSSPDSNCGSLNDEVSQSPTIANSGFAAGCSTDRNDSEGSAESSSDAVMDNSRNNESECEQVLNSEAQTISTSLQNKDCDDDDDSCSSSNI